MILTKSDAFDGRGPAEGEPVCRVIPRGSEECEKLFLDSARMFFRRVTSTVPGIRIVIVENLLSEKHGGQEGKVPFGNAEEIRRTNRILAGYYRLLEDILPEALYIRPAGDEGFYTDDAYEYGAVPQHLNEWENKHIAEEIAREFTERS